MPHNIVVGERSCRPLGVARVHGGWAVGCWPHAYFCTWSVLLTLVGGLVGDHTHDHKLSSQPQGRSLIPCGWGFEDHLHFHAYGVDIDSNCEWLGTTPMALEVVGRFQGGMTLPGPRWHGYELPEVHAGAIYVPCTLTHIALLCIVHAHLRHHGLMFLYCIWAWSVGSWRAT